MAKLFDMTAYYEPSSHFQFSRRVRSRFDGLAKEHYRPTWLLGKYGGRARMQTDIKGIGVATRVEIGRLALRQARQQVLVRDAFELFQEMQDKDLASGPIDRILVHFNKATGNPDERGHIKQAFADVFDDRRCNFLLHDRDLLELGHCIVYQSLVEYMREDGLYHSIHRDRIEKAQRHLQQEVGRYENFKFFVHSQAVADATPQLTFIYIGTAPDRKIEIFIQEHTGEFPVFVPLDEFQSHRESYTALEDYERASRRFGGLGVLQNDIVRYLAPPDLSVLYLFFGPDLQPDSGRFLSWEELFERQRSSPYINRASRNSPTFLEVVLKKLVRHGFVEDGPGFHLNPDFLDFKHVSFDDLGEHRRRL